MEVTDDPKLNNAITVIFRKQDHTLGGMLRSQLLLNDAVLFAGYRVPHPLETNIELRLQTDSSTTPRQALQKACTDLIFLTRHLKKQFLDQARTAEIGIEANSFGGQAVPMAGGEDVYGGVGFGGGEVMASQLASQQPEDPYAF